MLIAYPGFVAILLLMGGIVVKRSQKPPPKTPKVPAKQHPDGATKTQYQKDQEACSPHQDVSPDKNNASQCAKGQTKGDSNESDDETAEWTIRGYRMKITDFLLAIFTFLLVCVGIGQGVLLCFTNTNTQEAAKAAQKSAEIAERALIAGQRAFISYKIERSANIDPQTGIITHWVFTLIWYNSGQTPTKNMKNHVNIGLFKKEISSDWNFPDVWDDNIPKAERVGVPLGTAPKDSTRGQAVAISVADLGDVISGKKFLYLWGWASYNDVFPNTKLHIARFAVRVLVGGHPLDQDHISFSFPFLKTYNCSDEECENQGYPAAWIPPASTKGT